MVGARGDAMLGLSAPAFYSPQPAPVGAPGGTPSGNIAVGGTAIPGAVPATKATNGQVLTAWGALVVALIVAYLFFTPVDIG